MKIAETNEEREQAFKLRYEIFVEEIGYKPNHADHIKKTIQEIARLEMFAKVVKFRPIWSHCKVSSPKLEQMSQLTKNEK